MSNQTRGTSIEEVRKPGKAMHEGNCMLTSSIPITPPRARAARGTQIASTPSAGRPQTVPLPQCLPPWVPAHPCPAALGGELVHPVSLSRRAPPGIVGNKGAMGYYYNKTSNQRNRPNTRTQHAQTLKITHTLKKN